MERNLVAREIQLVSAEREHSALSTRIKKIKELSKTVAQIFALQSPVIGPVEKGYEDPTDSGTRIYNVISKDTKLSKNFTLGEFCHPQSKYVRLDFDLLQYLQIVREQLSAPIKIIKGYCPLKFSNVKEAIQYRNLHASGRCVHVKAKGYSGVNLARRAVYLIGDCSIIILNNSVRIINDGKSATIVEVGQDTIKKDKIASEIDTLRNGGVFSVLSINESEPSTSILADLINPYYHTQKFKDEMDNKIRELQSNTKDLDLLETTLLTATNTIVAKKSGYLLDGSVDMKDTLRLLKESAQGITDVKKLILAVRDVEKDRDIIIYKKISKIAGEISVVFDIVEFEKRLGDFNEKISHLKLTKISLNNLTTIVKFYEGIVKLTIESIILSFKVLTLKTFGPETNRIAESMIIELGGKLKFLGKVFNIAAIVIEGSKIIGAVWSILQGGEVKQNLKKIAESSVIISATVFGVVATSTTVLFGALIVGTLEVISGASHLRKNVKIGSLARQIMVLKEEFTLLCYSYIAAKRYFQAYDNFFLLPQPMTSATDQQNQKIANEEIWKRMKSLFKAINLYIIKINSSSANSIGEQAADPGHIYERNIDKYVIPVLIPISEYDVNIEIMKKELNQDYTGQEVFPIFNTIEEIFFKLAGGYYLVADQWPNNRLS